MDICLLLFLMLELYKSTYYEVRDFCSQAELKT